MSQKRHSTLTFDSINVSVFDIKREIIISNKLAGSDFDIVLEDPDTKEKYHDDSKVLQRSASILVRRIPVKLRGKNKGIQRYLNGTTPIPKFINKHSSYISVKNSSNNIKIPVSGSEDDRIKAIFQAQSDHWKETQKRMTSAIPIYNKSSSHFNMLSYPPSDYVCHRCGSKDHWIKNCPTKDDPKWDGKRVMKTTGIPKTFLKSIPNPEHGDANQGNYMITESGEYVVAVADDKSWKNHQQKSRAAAHIPNTQLVCPLTNQIFLHPVKTPCCSKTYEYDAIQQTLMDNDFKCPNCGKDEVLLEQLLKDGDTEEKLLKHKNNHDHSSNYKRKREEVEISNINAKKSKPIVTENNNYNFNMNGNYSFFPMMNQGEFPIGINIPFPFMDPISMMNMNPWSFK